MKLLFAPIPRTLALTASISIFPLALCLAADWPMLACNPRRTNYTDERIEFPYEFAWEARFEPERVSLKCQPVIAAGKVYIGTKSGNLYALDMKSGERVWKYGAGGAIEHTAAVDGGRVFFGTLDCAVHAVDCASGREAWVFRAGRGFTASALPVAGKVFIGCRNGMFYALNQADGSVAWEQDLGAPVFQSAAYNEGRIFIGAEDMKLRCLDAATGETIWINDAISGQSFRQYHPVITGGRVLVRVFPYARGFMDFGIFGWDLEKSAGGEERAREMRRMLMNGELPREMADEQDKMAAQITEQPWMQHFYVLDEKTGGQCYLAPSWQGVSMGGPSCPPAIDFEGKALVPVSAFDSAMTRMGRFDLDRGRLVDVLYGVNGARMSHKGWEEEQFDDSHKNWGGGNTDEMLDMSCAGPVVFFAHPMEGNCHFTGTFDLRTRRYVALTGSQRTPDGSMAARSTPFWDTVLARNNAFAIADGMFFHNSYQHVRAWNGAAPRD